MRPNQVWMSNITYIRLLAGFGYLSLITDAYTHEIIGNNVGPAQETVQLYKHLSKLCKGFPLLLKNSFITQTGGMQYASFMYVDKLKE